MNRPSFMNYDRRDPLELLNYEEKMRWWTKFCLWMVILCVLFTIANHFIGKLVITQRAEASVVVEDDAWICRHLNSNNTKGQAIEIYQYCLKYGGL